MAKNSDDGILPGRYTRNFAPVDDLDAEIDDLIPEPTREQRDLAMLMEELGSNATASVTVYRDTGKRGGGKGAYITNYHPSQKTLQEIMDYLRDAKRGGEFRFYIHDGKSMVGNRLVIVEPPSPEEMKAYDDKQRSLAPANQTGGIPQVDAVATLLQKMEADQQRRDEERREDARRREEDRKEEQRRRDDEYRIREERAREDRIREEKRADRQNELMLQLMTVKPEKSDLSELITSLVSLQTLTGNKDKESDFDKFTKFLAIREQLMGDAPAPGGESVTATAIKHLGAPLLGVIASLAKQPAENPLPRKQRVPAVAENSGAVNELPPPALPKNEATQLNPTQPALTDEERMTMLFEKIITAARNNDDPAPYADELMDTFGDDVCADLVEDDAKYELLLIQLKEVGKTHRQWFDKLRDIMLDSLFEDDPDTEADSLNEQNTDVSNESGD